MSREIHKSQFTLTTRRIQINRLSKKLFYSDLGREGRKSKEKQINSKRKKVSKMDNTSSEA